MGREQTETSQVPPVIPQLLIVLPGRKELFQVNPSQTPRVAPGSEGGNQAGLPPGFLSEGLLLKTCPPHPGSPQYSQQQLKRAGCRSHEPGSGSLQLSCRLKYRLTGGGEPS